MRGVLVGEVYVGAPGSGPRAWAPIGCATAVKGCLPVRPNSGPGCDSSRRRYHFAYRVGKSTGAAVAVTRGARMSVLSLEGGRVWASGGLQACTHTHVHARARTHTFTHARAHTDTYAPTHREREGQRAHTPTRAAPLNEVTLMTQPWTPHK